jgi:leader peptidase (prepilin peptidase)/N-methyltransferase
VNSTLLAVLVAAVSAGAGGLLVPRLIARIPEIEPEEADPAHTGGEGDGTVDATAPVTEPAREPEPPPEPFADIAALPRLAIWAAVASLVAGVVVGIGVGWTWGLVMWVPLVPVGVALALIDWRTRLLPTYVVRPTSVALVALALVGWAVTRDTAALERALIGGLVALVFFFVCFFIYPRGLGFGDVRLAGALGVALGWLGWGEWLVGLYSGFLLGGVIGGLLAVLKVVERKGVPFGPFMLLGALVGLLWGADVWSSLVTG